MNRLIFRPLLVALLAIAVIALPGAAAAACERACATEHGSVAPADAPADHACCKSKQNDSRDQQKGHDQPMKHGDCASCASACCRPAAVDPATVSVTVDEPTTLSIEPAPAATYASIGHDAIFHPPRA